VLFSRISNARHFLVKFWKCQKAVCVLPHEAKALLEIFCLFDLNRTELRLKNFTVRSSLTEGRLPFSRDARGSDKYIHNYFYISYMETLFVVAKIIRLPGSSETTNFVRAGPVNVVVSHWRRSESDGYFRLFSNSWKSIQSTNKNLRMFLSGEAKASSVSFWLRHCFPAKMIAYFFIQNCFKCDYDHYSAVAFGNAWITLWTDNMLRL